MVTGAPTPGGMRAPAPGGMRATPAGGRDVNDPAQQAIWSGYPAFRIEPERPDSGARVEQTRNVVDVHKGRATGAISSYLWTLPTKPGGSTATVTNDDQPTASFTPDVAGLYVFQCVVTFSDSTAVTEQVVYVSA